MPLHHPLRAAEAEVARLNERVATLERELKAAQNYRNSEVRSLDHYRNENLRLKAQRKTRRLVWWPRSRRTR